MTAASSVFHTTPCQEDGLFTAEIVTAIYKNIAVPCFSFIIENLNFLTDLWRNYYSNN